MCYIIALIEILTVDVPQVGAGRDAAVDPAAGGDLRDEIARLLHVLLEDGDHRRVLLAEELLRNRAALLAHAHLLGVLEEGLEILVATTTGHVGDGEEGAGLCTDLAPVCLEAGLVAHKGIGVNGNIVVAVPFPRIDEELINGDGVYTTGVGDEVGRHVATGADRLRIVGLDAAEVVTGVGHPIDVETVRLHLCHSGGTTEKESRLKTESNRKRWPGLPGIVYPSASAGVSKRCGKP
jgi:hypothetical protein